MNNDIILWIQGKSPIESPILSHNGQVITKDDKRYSKLFDIVSSTNAAKLIGKQDSTRIYAGNRIEGQYYLIHSNFNEVDTSGRKVAFMGFVGYDSSLENAISSIVTEAALYGYTIDVPVFKSFANKTKNRAIYFGVISVLFAIVLFVVIKILAHD